MHVGLFLDFDVRGNDVGSGLLVLVLVLVVVDSDGDEPGFESLVSAGGGEAVDAGRAGMIGGRGEGGGFATGRGLGGGIKISYRRDGGGVRGWEK